MRAENLHSFLKNCQLSDVPKNRLKAMFKQKQQTEQSTPSTRIYLWKASLSKIYESPIFGYGIGNYKEELIDEYDSRDMQKAKRIQLNSHNQFLDNWLAGGVVYFLLLIALVVEQFRIFIKSKSVIYGLFISSFTIFLLVESALQTKAGIFYFILFSSILYQSLNDSIFTTKSRR